MANTDITQRSQYERSDLLAGGEGLRRGSEKGAAVYSLIALVVGIVLCVAAVATIDNWAQGVVLGVIVADTVALMVAIGPNRKGSVFMAAAYVSSALRHHVRQPAGQFAMERRGGPVPRHAGADLQEVVDLQRIALEVVELVLRPPASLRVEVEGVLGGRGADGSDPVRLTRRLRERRGGLVVVVGEVHGVANAVSRARVVGDRGEVDPRAG